MLPRVHTLLFTILSIQWGIGKIHVYPMDFIWIGSTGGRTPIRLCSFYC